MNDAQSLQELLDEPGAPVHNWRVIAKKINEEFGRAESEVHRAALLEMFKATMDVAEQSIQADDLEKFRTARLQHYRTFIVQECLVGSNVCTESLFKVTTREVEAGRMAADDELRKTAEMAIVAPHHTRAELLDMARGSPATKASFWSRMKAKLKAV